MDNGINRYKYLETQDKINDLLSPGLVHTIQLSLTFLRLTIDITDHDRCDYYCYQYINY